MIVIADTSPLCYLILIEEVLILPQLFGNVMIPTAVKNELISEDAPLLVKEFTKNSPSWLLEYPINSPIDLILSKLHLGEREVILLAEKVNADLIILDEKVARKIAKQRGHQVIGLLGILDLATTRQLIDLPSVIQRLQKTNFRISNTLIQSLIQRHSC